MPRARHPTIHQQEPIWEQFRALLPERKTNHPLGCHRRRIPDRVVFEKLVQVLVFGCAYERIADESCSESTLRRRRDEWIELGVMERLRDISLDAYDRLIGLELSEVAVDGCITKAQKAEGRKRVKARWTGTKEGSNARRWWTLRASHLGLSQPRPKQPRLAAFGRDPRRRLRGTAEPLRRPPRPCL